METIIYRSRWGVTLPNVSFPDYVFRPFSTVPSRKPLFVDADHPDSIFLTYKSFRVWSKRLGAGLKAKGLRPSDRVLVYSGNDVFFPVIFMGVAMAGGVFTAANPNYTASELRHQISDSDPTFIIAAESSYATAIAAIEGTKLDAESIFVLQRAYDIFAGSSPAPLRPRVRLFTDLLSSDEAANRFHWESFSSQSQGYRTLALNYSSGTTGLSKGVEITHYNYIANTEALLFMNKLDPNLAIGSTIMRQLLFLPLFHAMAQTACFLSVVQGDTVYIMPRFDFIKMLEYVQKFRITDLCLAPSLVTAMVKDPRVKQYNLTSVARAVSGAAPLSPDVAQQFEALWPSGAMKLRQGWDLTGLHRATSLITTSDPRAPIDHKSVGELAPNVEAMIDVNREASSQNEFPVGEFLIRGPNVMKGYWRNQKATRETKLTGGWIRTGDIGYFDASGKVFIDLIKVNGFQVAPVELEAILFKHGAIADAAVIGVKCDGVEVPRAYVVLNPGIHMNPTEIQDFVRERLISYKRPTGGVAFVDSIPRNPSGKILRKELRKWAEKEASRTPTLKL
ncbi:putative 4-coumarate-CoA ligase [Aspergillus pseudoustus]|uniref:4-coumarate-CoA ligase n=1 Tax=Aspergillus pseudoustus TaxID=1810923 RepID=A0ABR4J3P4_9EURO